MATSKKKKDLPAAQQAAVSAPNESAHTAPHDEKRRPVFIAREDEVSASVWARTHPVRGKPMTFYSVSLERSYRDHTGQYRYTKNFDSESLGRLVTVIQRSAEYIENMARPREPEPRPSPDGQL